MKRIRPGSVYVGVRNMGIDWAKIQIIYISWDEHVDVYAKSVTSS